MEATMQSRQIKTLENEMAEAIRAWQRGCVLSPAQIELIDQARRAVAARALGFLE